MSNLPADEKLQADDEYEVVDIQIEELGQVPPKYFFMPDVTELVRRHVREDVVARGERVPAGCRALYAQRGSTQAAWAKLGAAQRDASNAIIRTVKDNVAVIVTLYGLLSLALLIFLIVKGVK